MVGSHVNVPVSFLLEGIVAPSSPDGMMIRNFHVSKFFKLQILLNFGNTRIATKEFLLRGGPIWTNQNNGFHDSISLCRILVEG